MGHQEQVPFKQRESQLPDKKTACTNHLFPGTSSLATKFNISLGHADVSNVSTTFTTHHLRHATDIIIIHQSFFINPHDWYLNILVQHAQVERNFSKISPPDLSKTQHVVVFVVGRGGYGIPRSRPVFLEKLKPPDNRNQGSRWRPSHQKKTRNI